MKKYEKIAFAVVAIIAVAVWGTVFGLRSNLKSLETKSAQLESQKAHICENLNSMLSAEDGGEVQIIVPTTTYNLIMTPEWRMSIEKDMSENCS